MDPSRGPLKEGPGHGEQAAGTAAAAKEEHHSDGEDSDNGFVKIPEPDQECEQYSTTIGVDQPGHVSLPVHSMIPSNIAGQDVTANKPAWYDGAELKKIGKKWILKVDWTSVILSEDIANSETQLEIVGGYIHSDDNIYEITKDANGKIGIVPLDKAQLKSKYTSVQEDAEKKQAPAQSQSMKEIYSGTDAQKGDGQGESKTSEGIGGDKPYVSPPTDVDRADTSKRSEETRGSKGNTSHTKSRVKIPSMEDASGADGKTVDQLSGKDNKNPNMNKSSGMRSGDHKLADVSHGDGKPGGPSTDQSVGDGDECTGVDEARHSPAGAGSGISDSATIVHQGQGSGDFKAEMQKNEPTVPPKSNIHTTTKDSGRGRGTDTMDGDGNPIPPPRTGKNRSVRGSGDTASGTRSAEGACPAPAEDASHRRSDSGSGKPIVVKGEGGAESEMTIVIIVLYEMIQDGILTGESKPTHYRCNLETYLKWNYVIRNSKLMEKKKSEYRKVCNCEITSDAAGILCVNMGQLKTKPDVHQVSHTVVRLILDNTDNLITNSFPKSGEDTMKWIEKVMESELGKAQELYLRVTDGFDVIHAVYPSAHKVKVSNIVASAAKELKQDEDQIVETRIHLQKVYHAMFQKIDLGKLVKERYPAISFDMSVAHNELTVRLTGLKNDITNAKKWLHETYIDKYPLGFVKIKEIRYAEKLDNLAHILKEVMERICSSFTDVYWDINKECSQINFIALKQRTVDEIGTKLQKIIKKKTLKLEGKLREVQRREQLCQQFKSQYVHIDAEGDNVYVYFVQILKENIMEEIGRWIEEVNGVDVSPGEAMVSTSACPPDQETVKAQEAMSQGQHSNTGQSNVTDQFIIESPSLFLKLKESNIPNALSTKFGVVAVPFDQHNIFGFLLMGPAIKVKDCKVHLCELISTQTDALEAKIDTLVDIANKTEIPEDPNGGHTTQSKPVPEPTNEPKTVKYAVPIYEYKVYQHLRKPGVIDELANKHNIVAELKGTKEKQGVIIQGTNEALSRFRDEIQQLIDKLKTGDEDDKQDDREESLSLGDEAGAAGGGEDQLAMTGEVMETTWTLPYQLTVVVSTADAKNCWKELLVEIDTSTSEVAPQICRVEGEKKRTVLNIPDATKNEGKAKDNLRTLIKKMLNEALTEDCFDIVLDYQTLGGWKPRKLMGQIVFGMNEFYSNGGHPPTVIRLCVQGSDLYTPFCGVCKQVFPDVQAETVKHVGNEMKPEEINRDPPGLTVNVITGSLHQTPAEVIVNTTNHTLDLGSGKVSSALLRKAGGELQNEAKSNRPRDFKYGEIVETKAYGLASIGCKRVLHGALKGYADGNTTQNLKVLYNFVYQCMIRADDLKCRVISFPAIGTGNLGYPKKEVAKTMFDAVKDFESKFGSESHLKEVKFVMFEKDTDSIREFQTQEGEYQRFKLERNAGTTEDQWSGNVNIGNVCVHAENGSITSVKAQGMIYLWEQNYTQGVMVQNHPLLKQAGVKIRQDWTAKRENYKKQPRGTPFITDGGNLNIPVIVHVPCGTQKPGIVQAFRTGLLEADNQRCHSVVIPFNQQHPLVQSAGINISDALLEAVNSTEMSLRYLRDVILVIEDETIFKAIKKRFNSWRGVSKTPSPSIMAAPSSQEIDSGIDVAATVDASGTQGRLPSEYLHYCVIKAIPEDLNEQKVMELIKARRMQSSNIPKVVFSAKQKEAVLICNSDADVRSLEKSTLPLQMELFRPKLINLERNVKESDLTISIEELNRQLAPIHVHVGPDKNDNSKIVVKAPTSCQMVCAVDILEKYTTNAADDDGFTNVEQLTISEDVWDILRIVEHDKVTNIQSRGKISFDNGALLIDYDATSSNSKQIVEELKSASLKLKDKQIEQIPLDDYSKAKRWCKEVGETLQTDCCVFVQDKNCVLAFCDTYEDMQKVRHQFKVKEGKVKVTARARRDFQVSEEDLIKTADESGPTSLQAMQSQLGVPVHAQPRKLSVDFVWNRDAKYFKSYKTPEGIQVYVYVADILKLPVDCIVNAANDSLQHGGGVAKVIARAAGYKLNNECSDYIRDKGNVPVGQACSTTAGKLHYDSVVHAVGPCWSHYNSHSHDDVKRCQIDLHSAVYNSFLQAEKRSLKSIALPAISSAIFGVPVEICVYNYAKATLDYSKKAQPGTALEEIHFIDVKKNIVKEIQDMFDVMIDQGREPPNYSIERYAQQSVPSYRHRSPSPYDNNGTGQRRNKNQSYGYQTRASTGNIASPVQSPSATGESPRFQASLVKYEDHGKQVYLFGGEQQKVSVYKGDILRADAHAIVSVEDESCHGTGRIAKELIKRIKQYSDYYSHKQSKLRESSRSIGDVLVTPGFDSGFRKILHAILPYTTSSKPAAEKKSFIAKTYWNIFETANRESIGSIALALMGAGPGKRDDINVSARMLLETFTEFCKKGLPLSINLVCFEQDKMTQVCQIFDQSTDQSSSGARSDSPPPRPPPQLGYNTRDHDTRRTEAMDTSPPMERSVHRREEAMEVEPGTGMQPGSTGNEDCVICMDKINEPKQLPCGHVFCTECIDQSFKHKEQCPTCGRVCGIITGTQPEGTILIKPKRWDHCSGYEHFGRIDITYTFPNGVQGEEHPTPGAGYKGISRTAYLPDNTQGQKISKMLKVAFDRKLVFTIGRSTTTGQSGVITWNDIHHKTNPSPHKQFGYPDPGYLDRVTEELAAKGVTEKDIK